MKLASFLIPLLIAACGCPAKSSPTTTSTPGSGTAAAPAPAPTPTPTPSPPPAEGSGTTAGSAGSAGGSAGSAAEPAPNWPKAAPGIGENCGPNDSCAKGLTCVSYYGIAGARGPQFKTCEIKCTADAQCPAGHKCVTVADGPGQVCRK